jgi:hypothetical protein
MFIHHGIVARLYLQFTQTQQILSNTKSHEAARKKKRNVFLHPIPSQPQVPAACQSTIRLEAVQIIQESSTF